MKTLKPSNNETNSNSLYCGSTYENKKEESVLQPLLRRGLLSSKEGLEKITLLCQQIRKD